MNCRRVKILNVPSTLVVPLMVLNYVWFLENFILFNNLNNKFNKYKMGKISYQF